VFHDRAICVVEAVAPSPLGAPGTAVVLDEAEPDTWADGDPSPAEFTPAIS